MLCLTWSCLPREDGPTTGLSHFSKDMSAQKGFGLFSTRMFRGFQGLLVAKRNQYKMMERSSQHSTTCFCVFPFFFFSPPLGSASIVSVCMRVCGVLCVCLFVCLLDCLFVCLFACLFVCLFAWLCVCLLACLFACLLVCLLVCLFVVCLFLCLFDCLFVSVFPLFLCLFVCLLACLFVRV